MVGLLIKEACLITITWLLGLIFFHITGVSVFIFWMFFCLLFFLLFFSGSLLMNFWFKRHLGLPGLSFALVSFFNQLVLVFFLFAFLKPQEDDHRIIAIAGLVGYLVCFIVDTRWKLKWINDLMNSMRLISFFVLI